MAYESDRWIELEEIPNARDLGGLPLREGRRVRSGLLLRSGALFGASPADAERLRRDYHLGLVVDLRTPLERAQLPDMPISGAENFPNPIFTEAQFGLTHELMKDPVKIAKTLPTLQQLYGVMVIAPACREAFSRALTRIMEQVARGGAALWHCTEGKDRCGLVSALLLFLLGADRETVLEDYLLTNRINKPKAEAYYREALARGIPEDHAARRAYDLEARPQFLDTALSAIDAQGGMETYLNQILTLDRDLIARFRDAATA